MIRIVIFDLDDVLYRYDLDVRLALLAEGLGRTPGEIRRRWLDSGFEHAAEAGRYRTGADYLTAFNALFYATMSVGDWCAARRRAMRPNPEVLAIAARIKANTPVILLTNNGPLVAERLADIAPDAATVFGDGAHASAEFSARKPERAVFERALARYGVAATEAVFIDDDAANVEGARAVGLAAHRFKDATGLEEFLRSLELC
jgi:putative hydrolase of the HAD superfamily